MKLRSIEAREVLIGLGMCGEISPDDQHACILRADHAGPHGWEANDLQTAIARLRSWCDDIHIGRWTVPQYENPGELRADLVVVLDALEAERS